MSNTKFDRCVAVVLACEGGYVDHPKDPGGATNRGITLSTLRAWRDDPTLTAEDVRALTEDEARAIYAARYWVPVRGDDLPCGVDLAVFDFAVNSGPRRAIRTLQAAVGVTQDGFIGRETLAAVRKARPEELIENLAQRRLAFLRGLSTWDTFGRGWTNRVWRVTDQALEMARKAAPLSASEAVRTDTVKASSAAAAAVAAGAAAVKEYLPIFQDILPVLNAVSPTVLILVIAAVTIFGVLQWRRWRT